MPHLHAVLEKSIKASLSATVASLVAQTVKCLPTMQETWVRSLGREDPLEKEMETHSTIHAWKIPWTEEPGGLQSMGSQRVGHDCATSLHFISYCVCQRPPHPSWLSRHIPSSTSCFWVYTQGPIPLPGFSSENRCCCCCCCYQNSCLCPSLFLWLETATAIHRERDKGSM